MLRGGDERPMFAFPGIWRRYQGPVKKDGPKVDLEVYAFLTSTPNKLVATINHERMPVLLTREEEFDVWLNGAPHVAFALAQEYPPGQMRIVQEGLRSKICSRRRNKKATATVPGRESCRHFRIAPRQSARSKKLKAHSRELGLRIEAGGADLFPSFAQHNTPSLFRLDLVE